MTKRVPPFHCGIGYGTLVAEGWQSGLLRLS